MLLKKEHLNTLLRIIGSFQAYIFAVYAGFLIRRAYDISLYSEITHEIVKEQLYLRYFSLAYSLLFILTIYGVVKISKWSIIVPMILGAMIFLFSFELVL